MRYKYDYNEQAKKFIQTEYKNIKEIENEVIEKNHCILF